MKKIPEHKQELYYWLCENVSVLAANKWLDGKYNAPSELGDKIAGAYRLGGIDRQGLDFDKLVAILAVVEGNHETA